MKKNRVYTIVGLVAVCAILLYLVYESIYLWNSTKNWLGAAFDRDAGVCTDIWYSRDTNVGKWYLELDDNRIYRINPRIAELQTEHPESLQGTPVQIICMPSTYLPPNHGLVVSLAADNQELLDSNQVREELRGTMIITWVMTALFGAILLIPALIAAVVALNNIKDTGTAWTFCAKKEKEKLKQEKMQRLREEGKLHPKKQLQKKNQKAKAKRNRPS